jgi:hypothetical protein
MSISEILILMSGYLDSFIMPKTMFFNGVSQVKFVVKRYKSLFISLFNKKQFIYF